MCIRDRDDGGWNTKEILDDAGHWKKKERQAKPVMVCWREQWCRTILCYTRRYKNTVKEITDIWRNIFLQIQLKILIPHYSNCTTRCQIYTRLRKQTITKAVLSILGVRVQIIWQNTGTYIHRINTFGQYILEIR